MSISVSSQSKFFDLTDLESVVKNRLDLSRFRLEIDLGLTVPNRYTKVVFWMYCKSVPSVPTHRIKFGTNIGN